ncbi:hypothetical protein SAMN06295998_10742 [Primorskyibacter flagellatus]|uniref:Uncharacterized protein n=1 Tax=Primorskyibacter flagellatus TaxID=1387277 RepID=A0A1W2CB51_9RHOB|nr:hypothetical protein SAMN06295998_10742 [Primorskyibacter flagellatus]
MVPHEKTGPCGYTCIEPTERNIGRLDGNIEAGSNFVTCRLIVPAFSDLLTHLSNKDSSG